MLVQDLVRLSYMNAFQLVPCKFGGAFAVDQFTDDGSDLGCVLFDDAAYVAVGERWELYNSYST